MSRFIEAVAQELRFAVRMLRKSPGFSTVAGLSVALGIGVNTSMFSVVNAVLLRTVPFPDPTRLVRLVQQHTGSDVTIPEYQFVKEHGRIFSSVAAYRGGGERRLNDDVGLTRAQADVAGMSESLSRALGGNVARNYRGLSVLSYHDWLVGDVRMNLVLLFGATGLLLLISCANVAMLLLTRTAARAKEIGVRLALGGGRRLLLQFLCENLVVAALGAAVGVLAAYQLVRGFVAWAPFTLPASAPIHVDRSVLAFTVFVSLGTAVVFTLVPFFSTRRLNVQACLRSEGRTC
jgi:FtsX-like permease family